jgi:hypothetical protein
MTFFTFSLRAMGGILNQGSLLAISSILNKVSLRGAQRDVAIS